MARSIYTEQEAQFLKNIGYRVQFFRKKAGLSQEELAERCGMSYSTISHIESTSPYPMSIVALYRIANVLGISPYQLLRFDRAAGGSMPPAVCFLIRFLTSCNNSI